MGPPKVDLLDPKVDFLNLSHSLNPPTKTSFLAHFVAKSGPLTDLGGASHPPPGYGPGNTEKWKSFDSYFSIKHLNICFSYKNSLS